MCRWGTIFVIPSKMVHSHGLYCFLYFYFVTITMASGQKCSPSKVESPGFPSGYPDDFRCSWLLTSNDDANIVQFTATNLNLEECSPPCSCDYVEIFDGATRSSKSLGKFCKGTVRMFSSGRNMLVVFRSDKSQGGAGFSALYKNISKNSVCSKTSDSIQSTFRYYGNVNCNWLIDAGSRNVTVMERITLSYHQCSDCTCGQVEIFDGRSDSELRLGSFCSTESARKPELISTGRYMYVKFTAKSFSTYHQFKAIYKIIRTQTVCSRVSTSQTTSATSGILKSYDYPSKYIKGKVECYWPIAAAEDQVIRLTVETLDVNGNRNDVLEVFDGKSSSSPQLGKWYSGKPDLVSSGNHLVVTFKTTNFAIAKGLKARFYIINKNELCKEAPQDKGSISSYEYPKSYPGNLQCTWLIKATSQSVVRLTAGNLNFPSCHDDSCDYLEVYNGSTKYHPRLARFTSGQAINLVSTSDRLLVIFKANVLIKNRGLNGFHAQYYSIKENEVCPGSGTQYATRDETKISSPNYPSSYWGNLHCAWHIEAQPDYVIRLTVQALYIEDCQPNCNCDYLEIFSGPPFNRTSLGKWCGRDAPDLLSTGRNMYVVMRTNLFNFYRGFKAVYSSIHKDKVCPGNELLVENSGIIRSPGYPKKYKGSHTCIWMIKALPNQVIHLHTRSKSLKLQKCGQPTECTCDYLEVFNGLGESTSIGRWCESKLDILSSGRFLKLIFTSDEDTGGEGFELEYLRLSKSKVCPKVELSSTKGTISTFNYPSGFSGNSDCTWIFKAPVKDSSVHLEFQDFSLGTCDPSLSCAHCGARVQAQESLHSSNVLDHEPWCRTDAPKSVFFHGPEVNLTFRTTYRTFGKGFRAKYRYIRKNLGCRATGMLKKSSGNLLGPDYPFGKIPEYFCVWQIKVPNGNKIKITVTYQSVQEESNSNCLNHFVEFFDGPLPTNKSLGRICKNTGTKAVTLTTSGPNLYVMLWIHSNLDQKQRPTFSATYQEMKDSEPSGSILTAGKIAGIAIGCIFAVVIIIMCLLICVCIRRRSHEPHYETPRLHQLRIPGRNPSHYI